MQLSEPESSPSTTSASTSTSSSTASSSQAAEEAKDHWIAIIHGRVHTVTGPVLFDATVLAKNGKIVEIGKDVQLPSECEVIDAHGKHFYFERNVQEDADGRILVDRGEIEDAKTICALLMWQRLRNN